MRIHTLAELARESGLELFGALDLEAANAALGKHQTSLKTWQDAGYAGEMEFMQRPAELFTDLRHFLPEVSSVVGFAVSYLHEDRSAPDSCCVPPPPPGYGRVARYAWGRDYHKVLKKRLLVLLDRVRQSAPYPLVFRVFSDAVPLLERALAAGLQLGFTGKNCMLIRPGVGSFTFLAEILWNVELEPASLPAASKTSGCGSCSRCLTACPTQAFTGPYQMDARRCISYLTIEKRTELTEWEQGALGSWLFGCDICQEVCPYNHKGVPAAGLPEFSSDNGAGPYLQLEEILSIGDDRAFERKFGGTPLMRAKRTGLVRNACCVAANTGYQAAIPLLKKLASGDASELVRNQARDSLARLEG